ncbi:MAG: TetR/AcrR family transcriptional regulator [Rhizobiaceae bacterium]
MREENKAARQRQIEKAAYAVLDKYGYEGVSMLKIARHAKASNETLYRWYGDKRGLFRALVTHNASEIKKLLEEGLSAGSPAVETLRQMGPILLSMLTGPRAVSLNRAAASDPTGELGREISKSGRETIAPLIGRIIARAAGERGLDIGDAGEAASIYINLLVGDLQIRRVIGREPAPDQTFIHRRSEQALANFLKIFGRQEPAN